MHLRPLAQLPRPARPALPLDGLPLQRVGRGGGGGVSKTTVVTGTIRFYNPDTIYLEPGVKEEFMVGCPGCYAILCWRCLRYAEIFACAEDAMEWSPGEKRYLTATRRRWDKHLRDQHEPPQQGGS